MTGVSTLGQSLAQIRRIQVQEQSLANLSTQLATGRRTQRFSGLSTDVLSSQRSRSAIQSLEAYNNNITNASRRIELTQAAVQEFQQQARNFLDVIRGLPQESTHQEGEILVYDDPATPEIEVTQVGVTSAEPSVDLRIVTDFANNIFETFTSLINAQDGDRYLLSGAETRSQPLNDTGTLQAALGSLIAEWKGGNISTDDLIADLSDRTTESNPNALTDSTVGYSLELANGEAGDIFVRADERVEINYTTLASDDAFRDILVAVSYFKTENLPPIVDAYIPPNTATPPFTPDVEGAPGETLDEQTDNFFAVVNALATSVSKAVDELDLVSFKLATAQARITEISVRNDSEQNFLQGIVSDIEDVDQNEVALQLNVLLTQLETSFAVTARVQQLSLVNFI